MNLDGSITSEDYRELLIGCGRSRQKRVAVPGSAGPAKWRHLTTLDINQNCDADLWCDLNALPTWHAYPLRIQTLYRDTDSLALNPGQEIQHGVDLREPQFRQIALGVPHVAHELLSDYWDEIHAYEVLEHLGQQGDAHSFLAHFSELWRLLKPNGYLCATVPSWHSRWVFGDPSHRRVIVPESLVFLDQEQYARQCDVEPPTPMSDFRDTCGYRADFRLIDSHDNRTTFTFILQAVKPSRYKLIKNEQFGKLAPLRSGDPSGSEVT